MEFYNKNKGWVMNFESIEELKEIFCIFAPSFKK